MKNHRLSIVVPVIIVVVGVGWLLTTHNVIGGVNWVWVLGLAAAGVLTMALGGIDKFTFVVGPFLIIATIFSILRQTDQIKIDTEVPCMMIIAGLLILLARFLPVPTPQWYREMEQDDEDDQM